MIKGESEYIEEYKRAQYRLPDSDNLGALWAPDFDPENYPGLDSLAGLEVYLGELSKYTKKLSKAAYLRQRHFDLFLKDRVDRDPEDDGHRYWRLGMNQVADDAVKTLAYWTKIRDDMLSKAISDYVARPIVESLPFDPSTRNVDVAYRPADKKSIPRIVRMKSSQAQKKIRQKLTKKAIAARKAVESKLLESASKDYVEEQKNFNYDKVFVEPKRSKTRMTWGDVMEFLRIHDLPETKGIIFSPSNIVFDEKGMEEVIVSLGKIYAWYMCSSEDYRESTTKMNVLIRITNVLVGLYRIREFFDRVWAQTCYELQNSEKEPYIGDGMFIVMARLIDIREAIYPTSDYDSFMKSLKYLEVDLSFGGREKWPKFYTAIDMVYPIYMQISQFASVNTGAITDMSKPDAILIIKHYDLKPASFKPVIPKQFAGNDKYVEYVKNYAWFYNRSKNKLFYIATH